MPIESALSHDFDDLIKLGKELSQRTGRKTNRKASAPTALPKNLPRVLTHDPYETLGIELHVGVTTCAYCGTQHRHPLAGRNTLVRRVRLNVPRLPEERLINGPSPWISASKPINPIELEDWSKEIKKEEIERLGVETVEHHFSCERCENCTEETSIVEEVQQFLPFRKVRKIVYPASNPSQPLAPKIQIHQKPRARKDDLTVPQFDENMYVEQYRKSEENSPSAGQSESEKEKITKLAGITSELDNWLLSIGK